MFKIPVVPFEITTTIISQINFADQPTVAQITSDEKQMTNLRPSTLSLKFVAYRLMQPQK